MLYEVKSLCMIILLKNEALLRLIIDKKSFWRLAWSHHPKHSYYHSPTDHIFNKINGEEPLLRTFRKKRLKLYALALIKIYLFQDQMQEI